MKYWQILIAILFCAPIKSVLHVTAALKYAQEKSQNDSTVALKRKFNFLGDFHTEVCPQTVSDMQMAAYMSNLRYAEAKKEKTLVYMEARKKVARRLPDGFVCTSSIMDMEEFIKQEKFTYVTVKNIDPRHYLYAARYIAFHQAESLKMDFGIPRSHCLYREWVFDDIKESFPFDLRCLTLQHFVDEYNCSLEQARVQRDSLEAQARSIYVQRLNALEREGVNAARWFEELISSKGDQNFLDFIAQLEKEGNADFIKQVLKKIELMLDGFFDLNLFYNVISLEQSDIKKVIVVTGSAHTKELVANLTKLERYTCLAYIENPQYIKIDLKGNTKVIKNVPLKITLFGLIDMNEEELEEETKKIRLEQQKRANHPWFYYVYDSLSPRPY